MGRNTGTLTATPTAINTMTIDPLTPAQQQRLATWFGAGFPIGAFSYSHGLEAAFEAGLVDGRDNLAEWIEGLLLFGSGRTDAILFAAANRATPDVAEVAALAAALSPSMELRAETLNQGEAFLRAVRQGWPELSPRKGEALSEELHLPDRAIALPVAAGLCCALAQIPLYASLLAYLHAFAANIVSAALRSMPIGQSDGLAVHGRMEAAVSEATEAALTASLDDIGSATPMLDWLSATHETQYSRLFRS